MQKLLISFSALAVMGLVGLSGISAPHFSSGTASVLFAQDAPANEAAPDLAEIRQRLQSYLAAFNDHDAAALGAHWSVDGISVDEETGTKTEGRDAIQQDFVTFFAEHPEAKLSGHVDSVRRISTSVAEIEGQSSLYLGEGDPIQSAFSAIVVKEGNQWLINSTRERDLPAPTTSYDALKGLEWLVGTWRDESDQVMVDTTVRWSTNRAFLIRSFRIEAAATEGAESGEVTEGTQVIGWDPSSKQIRTWTFHSDGSFGEGTITQTGDVWIHRQSHVLSDGTLASATRFLTRTGNDSFTVETVGQTVNGEPIPASPAVTVVRVDTPGSSSSPTNQSEKP